MAGGLIYNSLLRKNYAMLTVVFTSAFAFQSFYDIGLNRVWDNINRGRQWKDIRSRYIEAEDEE